MSAERKTQRVLVADDLDLSKIGNYLEGLTGAQIRGVINRLKRTMVMTKRALGHKIVVNSADLETAVEFDTDQADSLVITTNDVIAMTTSYQLERFGLSTGSSNNRDDEPPEAAAASR